MKPFLFEIGSEEIPARFIKPAKEGVLKLLKEGLESLRIGHGAIAVYGTPRRMAVLIQDMEEKQTDTTTVKFGPPAARAYDASGAPLPAATGFAKSQGVDVSELKVRKKENAELICVEKSELGRRTVDVLAELLPDIISRIPFQKKMRWGKGTFQFARPIHWIVALLGDEIIPFTVAGITSGNASRGHRFLSSGDVIIAHAPAYIDHLREHYVVVDEQERRATMTKDIDAIQARAGARAVTDPDLLEEIQYITEYPYGLQGTFEEEYLALPRAVLVNVMKGHQRYIPLEKDNGTLVAGFIFFANTVPADPSEVIRGNEKVLRARLADGKFFFEEDKKVRLDDLYERLDTVMFHKKLGSVKEKTRRVAALGAYLASIIDPGLAGKVDRASRLIKADLLSHMVGEFPELQGTMGTTYAASQGEETDVAAAIEEHYMPTGVDAPLPQSTLGSIMALADKLDSLIAFFSVGITPTGNLDPFALRRQAIGSIRTIIANNYHVSLQRLFETGYEALGPVQGKVPIETLKGTLGDFIATRFKFLMMEEGHNQEFVNSVLPALTEDIYDAYIRLRALETQRSIEDFSRLMVGFKRVYNITKTLKDEKAVDPALIEQQEEKDLFALYESKKDAFQAEMQQRRYAEAISILVGFKETIDHYFDKVFVMVEDERVKANRLSLLTKIKDMFLKYGDFSKIRVEELS